MARSLTSQEAEVFTEEIRATQKFPLVNDSAKDLPKGANEAFELPSAAGLWFGSYFPGVQEF